MGGIKAAGIKGLELFRITVGGAITSLLIFIQAVAAVGLVGTIFAAALSIVGVTFVGNYMIAAVAWLAAGVMGIALELTGGIFNYFIDHFVVGFSSTIESLGILGGIDIVWTGFRDVANIVIIGLFVFIAINIILGVKEFGEKKAVAKVLIIAVLLNFSLLFTKIIIDASNFTAYQFYKSAGLERAAGSKSGGVADAFLYAAGITTTWDTAAAVKKLGEDQGLKVALVLVIATILLNLAMITLFLYGAFQMVSRGILLIALMVTSPLAFASWLIPHTRIGGGWATWWETLLKSAFFAPLFMMALWASMLLLKNAHQARGGKTLGEFFSGSTPGADAWVVVATYLFAAGFLYLSIKLASSFAGSITGFGYAASAAFAPLGLGSRFIAAPVLRQTAGRLGYSYSKWQTAGAEESLRQAAAARKLGLIDRAQSLQRTAAKQLHRAERGDIIAGGRMNLMDTPSAKAARSLLGVAEGTAAAGLSSSATKSLAKQIEERTKAAAERTEKIAPSADKVREEMRMREKPRTDALANDIRAKQQTAAMAKRNEDLERRMREAQEDHDRETRTKSDIEARHSRGEINDAEREHQLIAQNERIAKAREKMETIRDRIKAIDRPIDEALRALKDHEDGIEKRVRGIVESRNEGAARIAVEVGRREGRTLDIERMLGKATGVPSHVGTGAAKLYRQRQGTRRLRSVLELLREESPQPSATPSSGTSPAGVTTPKS